MNDLAVLRQAASNMGDHPRCPHGVPLPLVDAADYCHKELCLALGFRRPCSTGGLSAAAC